MVRPLFVVISSALSLALLAGCTQPLEEGTGSESSASSGTTTSPGPRYVPKDLSGARYNVFVGTAPCVSIPGAGGTWRAAPTFAGDPSFCAYWWADKTPFDLAALSRGVESEGILSDTLVEDVACENLMEVIGAASQCQRPVVSAAYLDPGGGGGGQYSCRSCVKGSYSGSKTSVNVVIPQPLITSTPSRLIGIFDGKRFEFWQPGATSAFTVSVPAHTLSSGTACAPAVVTPSSNISPGGACGT